MTARVLRCTGPCRKWVRVYEAAQGARTVAEHQWIDPAQYMCWECQQETGRVSLIAEFSELAITGGEGSSA